MYNGKNYRIFLTYRGGTEGEVFCDKLIKHMKDDPLHKQLYGDVWYSRTESNPGHNFKDDLVDIFADVKYIILPLTQNYFDGFLTEEGKINDESITYHELKHALALGRECKFICVTFPGFEFDANLLEKLYGKTGYDIMHSRQIPYAPEKLGELFLEIEKGFANKLPSADSWVENESANVHLDFKGSLESNEKYPFYQMMYGIRRISLLNFAGSSFISGQDGGYLYRDDYRNWFSKNLREGKIEAQIVLTNPHSFAAFDAAAYKMKVSAKDSIILDNVNKLYQFKHTNPNANISIYLTNVALPYGIIQREYLDSQSDNIKIDIYAPETSSDAERPSFFLLKKDAETKALYDSFIGCMNKIKNNNSFLFNGHPDTSWLISAKTSKTIIHRGMLNDKSPAHRIKSLQKCIDADCPIEVDLMRLRDGTIIVGRADEQIGNTFLNELNNVIEVNKTNTHEYPERILTLEDLLDLVHGNIPLLLEVKTNGSYITDENEEYAKEIAQTIIKYIRNNIRISENGTSIAPKIAIHSANPYIIECIKKIDCLIPCGLITRDFSELHAKGVLNEDFYQYHANMMFTDDRTADFISCDITYDKIASAKKYCAKEGIPLLGWTVKSTSDMNLAKLVRCDNVIIEGAKDY